MPSSNRARLTAVAAALALLLAGLGTVTARAGTEVTAVLGEARRRAPSARVLALDYPANLPDAGAGCWPVLPVAYGTCRTCGPGSGS